MYPQKFWTKNPALLYGLSALLGTYFVLLSPLALFPFLFLLHKKELFAVVFFFFLPFVSLYHLYPSQPSGSTAEGRFEIQTLRKSTGFAQGWLYTGILKTQEGRFHCRIRSKTHHPATCAYKIKGLLFTQNQRYYTLKSLSFEPIENSHSLAEFRYEAKKRVAAYIARGIKQKRAAHFLTGMVTGELEDPLLLNEFGHLGLSHIMAISGFHFALLTFTLHLLLRLFLPSKIESALLMILLTLYLLFIGDSPSIQRAWCMAMIFLLGQLIERPPSPLNSLGVALLIATLVNPLSTTTVSFQLSFLATGGILLCHAPLHQLLSWWLPKLPLQEVIERPLLWQHGYLFAALFRQAFTLTLAVNVALLPLFLIYFHTFSFNNLIYNLFFPFCAGAALFLFLLGVVTGGLLHPLNGWCCEKLLTLTEFPPLVFKSIYIENISPVFTVIYITTLFIFMICYNEYYDRTDSQE